MIVENLLVSRHCTKFLQHTTSLTPNDFRRISPSYRRGDKETERLRNSPKVTKLKSHSQDVNARIESGVCVLTAILPFLAASY